MNFFDFIDVSKKKYEAALERICRFSATSLNESQLGVIHDIKSFIGGIQLVQASKETAKQQLSPFSLMLIGKQQFSTLLCAPTNTAIDELCLRYAHLFCDKSASLRVYASDYDQENTVLGINCREKDSIWWTNFSYPQTSSCSRLFSPWLKVKRVQKSYRTGSDLLSKYLEFANNETVQITSQYVDERWWRIYHDSNTNINGSSVVHLSRVPRWIWVDICELSKLKIGKSVHFEQLAPKQKWH